MGLRFGQGLGLPRALSDLPVAPLVPGYRELDTLRQDLGLRHAAESFLPRGEGLRVLDGLFVSDGPARRRRVTAELLRQAARQRPQSAELIDGLARVQERDPWELRRLVLYQLIGLLQDHPTGDRTAAARKLGVEEGEAEALAFAAGARPRLTPAQRAAGEALADACEDRALRLARRLIGELPTGNHGDRPYERLVRRIEQASAAADAALAEARRREQAGEPAAAGERYLEVLRLVADDRQALAGLVRAHRPSSAGQAPLRSRLGSASVDFRWETGAGEAGGQPGRWRLFRFTRLADQRTAVAKLGDLDRGRASDPNPPYGEQVRYAVLPLTDGQVAGPPLVSRALLVAPEVSEPVLGDGRGRVTAEWRKPPAAVEVRVVTVTAPEGGDPRLEVHEDGLVAHGLVPGPHRFRISCRYRAADGREVDSPGVVVERTVHHWPEPVVSLAATADSDGDGDSAGGRVRFDWTGGDGAEVRLVEWPGAAPAPGTETTLDAVPEPLPWPGAGGLRTPPPGADTRVTAVAVLGGRAVVGPGVWIEVPPPVDGLSVERAADGPARVTFDWPPGAGRVSVEWEQGGVRRTEAVARSSFLRGGLQLPVGPGAARFRAAAEPRRTGAVVVPAAGAAVVLPADVTIAYRIVQARGPFRRRPPVLRVTVSEPAAQEAGELPEFVLVARPGARGDLPRPRTVADGTTVLRLSGEELRGPGGVERELAYEGCPPPFSLRAFLVGSGAAAVRLQEPSLETLVVR